MTTAQISPPASEPLGLTEIRQHLRIDGKEDDVWLLDTLRAARSHTEWMTGQKFITQSWRQYEDHWPRDGVVPLNLRPVQSVLAVTAYDGQGNPNVLAEQDYQLRRNETGHCLVLTGNGVALAATNGLEIDLVVGTGDHGLDVPDTIRRAILLLVTHWYEFRGAIAPNDQPVSLPAGYESLLRPFQRLRLT